MGVGRINFRNHRPGEWLESYQDLTPLEKLSSRQAGMAELADARDLKSRGEKPCGFDSHCQHHFKKGMYEIIILSFVP
jgi:hypothetical protein